MNLIPAFGTSPRTSAFARVRDHRIEWLLGMHPVTAAMLAAIHWFPSKGKALRRLNRLVVKRRIRLVGTISRKLGRPEHVFCRWQPKTDDLLREVESKPNFSMLSARTNGSNQLEVRYAITGEVTEPMQLTVARSADSRFDANDATLGTINLSGADLTVGEHTKWVTIGSGSGNVGLTGAGAADYDADHSLLAGFSFVDAAADDNWAAITGPYHLPGGAVYYHGTGGADTVTLANSGSRIRMTVNGVSTFYTASDVSTFRAWLHNGADRWDAGAVNKRMMVNGGDDGDWLTASAAGGTWVGGAGNDKLEGKGGRDIQIGGLGADVSIGGGGEDLQIAGEFLFTDPLGLNAIDREWTRTDRTFAQRSANLQNGTGYNGTTRITAATAPDDGAVDRLTGGAGADWFVLSLVGSSPDVVTDRAKADRLNWWTA